MLNVDSDLDSEIAYYRAWKAHWEAPRPLDPNLTQWELSTKVAREAEEWDDPDWGSLVDGLLHRVDPQR